VPDSTGIGGYPRLSTLSSPAGQRPKTPAHPLLFGSGSGGELVGRSTVGKALVALERRGVVRSQPGGRDGRRPVPHRWSAGQTDGTSSSTSVTQRLRPGQLDRLVVDYLSSQVAAVGATVVAKALGRSAGAVGNCLTRLAAAGRVRKVSDKPRRYSSTTSSPGKGARPARARDDKS
jgi:hypothetical protein